MCLSECEKIEGFGRGGKENRAERERERSDVS